MAIRASLLFDLDGTLVDTDSFHFKAYEVLLSDYDKTITLETYKKVIMGAQNDVTMSFLFPELPEGQYASIAERKEDLFRSFVVDLEPIPGLQKVFSWADANDIGVAIVTNAPRANAELLLQGLKIAKTRYPLVIGDELERGKPDPLPYLTGVKHIDGVASRSLAFEDSPSGIRSACAAGIRTIGLRTSLEHDALTRAGATDTISDYNEDKLWATLEQLVREG